MLPMSENAKNNHQAKTQNKMTQFVLVCLYWLHAVPCWMLCGATICGNYIPSSTFNQPMRFTAATKIPKVSGVKGLRKKKCAKGPAAAK